MLRNIRSDVYVVPPGIDYNYYAKCASNDREFDVGIILSASHVGSEELVVRKGSDLYDLVLRGSGYSFIGNKYSMYYLRNWARFAMLVDKPSLVYCSARVLLWLSRSEGFGLPPLEAMASGTPVVYTDAPAHNKHTCCFKIPVKYTWVFDEPNMAYTFLMHEPDVKGIFTALDVAVQNYRDYRDYVMDLAKQYDLKEFSKSLADWLLNAHR
jgi:glycosyltransferase involved in cell wall biosynthesis